MLKPSQVLSGLGAALLALFFVVSLSAYQPPWAGTMARISADQQEEARALVGPYGENEIADGWRVASFQIPGSYIRFGLSTPNGDEAVLLLKHPSQSNSREKTRNFAIERVGPETAKNTMDVLARAIRDNEPPNFWPKEPKPLINKHVRAFFTDGVVLSLLALLLVLVHLHRVLKETPTWVPWALAGFVVFGTLLRLAVSPETVMNAWPYTRTPPLVELILNGSLMKWVTERFELTIYLTDAIHVIDLILASLTPLVFFAHARFALKSWKGALFAAGVLVILPIHLHFSRSDVEYVQSLVTSSLTFITLYTALQDPSRAWRWGALALLPVLSMATYDIRPENMVFVVVDVGAVLLTAGHNVSVARRARVLTVVIAVASYSFVTRLLVNYGGNVNDGLSLKTLESAAATMFAPAHNTLINTWITPPLVIILAGAGLVVLLRGGQWRRALYLSGWLAGFFVVHSYILPGEPAMMARYHMHLITPTLLLVGAAAPLFTVAPRWVSVALIGSLALSPLIHRSFIGASDFMVMQEYDVVRENRDLVPHGCTVLEFLPIDSLTDPLHANLGDSRIRRQGMVLSSGVATQKWQVISLARIPENQDPLAPRQEQLTPEVLELLANPPECLAFLEGITCQTHKPRDAKLAPACKQVLEQMHTDLLFERTFVARIYDERNTGRIDKKKIVENRSGIIKHHGLVRAGDSVHVALHRLFSRESDPRAPHVDTTDGP